MSQNRKTRTFDQKLWNIFIRFNFVLTWGWKMKNLVMRHMRPIPMLKQKDRKKTKLLTKPERYINAWAIARVLCVSKLLWVLHSTWFTWISSSQNLHISGCPGGETRRSLEVKLHQKSGGQPQRKRCKNPYKSSQGRFFLTWVFPKIVVPQNGWFLKPY